MLMKQLLTRLELKYSVKKKLALKCKKELNEVHPSDFARLW